MMECLQECLTPSCVGTILVVLVLLVLIKKHFGGGVYKQLPLNLSQKYAVITGGNSGIGAQTVKYFNSLGCSVVIGARDRKTAENVIKECQKVNPDCKVEFIRLDLADRASIKSFAQSVPFQRIDFLINNAGIMAIPTRKLTKQGLQMQWAINHLGHFYLTYLLWPKIKKSSFFRVVNVSSLAHHYIYGFFGKTVVDWDNLNFQKDYDQGVSYGRSKLYNVLFTKALAQRINSAQGRVSCLHPGVVRTELTREMRGQGFGKFLFYFMNVFIYPLYWLLSKSAWQGCQTNIHCALSKEVENGGYYADCKRAKQNDVAVKQNWDRLWAISQKQLHLNFAP